MRFLKVFVLAFSFCSVAFAGGARYPESMPKELAAYIDSLPNSARSLDDLLVGFTKSEDIVELSSTKSDGSSLIQTTTVDALVKGRSSKTDPATPSNPEIGDEITFTQVRTMGNAVYRISWTMTWMFNPDTGRNEWIQTGSSSKFLRWVNNSMN